MKSEYQIKEFESAEEEIEKKLKISSKKTRQKW